MAHRKKKIHHSNISYLPRRSYPKRSHISTHQIAVKYYQISFVSIPDYMYSFVGQVNIKSNILHNSNQVSIDTIVVEILTLIGASLFTKQPINVMTTIST